MSENDAEERIKSIVRDHVQRAMERMTAEVFGATMTNTNGQETMLDVNKFLRDTRKWLLLARRGDITFRVDMAHQGPMLKIETPDEGTIFEMSFTQAQQVHQQWPLRLHRVLDEHSAEFVPASAIFNDFVTRVLPMPPFELPTDDEDQPAA